MFQFIYALGRTSTLALFVTVVFSASFSQMLQQESDLFTFHVDTHIVLVDVIPEYQKEAHATALLTELKREDFHVFDNKKEMPIESFDVGSAHSTRPIALWLIVQCPEGYAPEWHSEFMRGKTQYLRPPLGHLESNDVVGVAHWCDNGAAEIDLAPGHNPDAALSAVEGVLNRQMNHGQNRSGEQAMQKMIRLIVSDAHRSTPERLPVMVFLYGDHCGTYAWEADKIIEDVVATSGIVFGISDGRWRFEPGSMFNHGEVGYLVHYYSEETGGDFYTAADPKIDFAAALDYVLSQVHLRYTLGFKPSATDGKRHKVKVELTKTALARFKGVQLRYRKEYLPITKLSSSGLSKP
jgi:hypothetical protein